MTRHQIWTIISLIVVFAAALVSASTANNGSKELAGEDEDLKNVMTSVSDISVPVIVVLREQPANDISIKVKGEYRKDLDDISKPAREIYGRMKPFRGNESELIKKNLPELIANEQSLLTEKEKTVLKEVGEKLDSKKREMRHEILNRTVPLAEKSQTSLIDKIKAKGGNVKYSSRIFNAIAADIPVTYIEELSKEHEIYKIYQDNLLKANLDISTQAMGANTWWGNGYNGSSMDAAIIDTGIDGTHPALHVDYAKVFHATGMLDPLYGDDSNNTDDLHGHGTHVAGIVASTNPTYNGVGYGIDKLINAKSGWRGTNGGGYMYLSDGMEAIDWAIFGNTDDADVISLSFGGGTTNGNSGFEYFLDAIAYDLDISVAVAAGNNGSAGSYSVGEPAGAYNIISVGNINDKNTISRADDSLSPSSSRGPTWDGRIKPDISAPGTAIISSYYNWEGGNPDFIGMSGTSMAAPHIAGSILLVLDYKNSGWKPEAIKALLLNTAEDKGLAGPDNDYGFGYTDISNAYLHRDNVLTDSITNSSNGSVEKFYKGPAYNGDKATLVWNRHVTYNGINEPNSYHNISDLDLYMYDEANSTQVSFSISRKDNVEQVKSNASYDPVILKIDPYDTFPDGIDLEDYALATDETFEEVIPPILNLNFSNPENVNSGDNFILNISVNNSGEISAHNVSVNITLPSGFSIISGAKPQAIGTINNGSSKMASWVVKAAEIYSSARYGLNASATSRSYGESFSGEGNNTILVIPDGYINGTVLSNGAGISSAVVTANTSISTITSISGFYSLKVPAGTYYLTAIREPEYYPNNSVVVEIQESTVAQDIYLDEKPKGIIAGSVRNR